MNPLIIGLALWQGSKLVKGSSTAEKLEYFPKNLDFKDGKFYFRMEILNPTRNKLKIDSFFGGIYYSGNKIGSIEYATPINLDPNKRTEVRIPKVAVLIIQGKAKDLKFNVIGVARALGLNNPVNEEIKLM